MNVIEIAVSKLTPYENNPRNNAPAVDAVAESIREFGFKQPIVIDKENVVVCGHTRLLAAKKLKLKKVPCVIADDLTEEQIRAYRLADNKVAELAGWNEELLAFEMGTVQTIDMSLFGFKLNDDFDDGSDFFENRDRYDTSGEEGNDEYNEFIEKFEPKKTTDDCYTPDLVYNAVADWVCSEYSIEKDKFVRPFYPGGDYQKFKYPKGSVVVDNPPFSILSEILKFYDEKKIPYFLFAPNLTLFSSAPQNACALCVGASVIYENGANVNTSFLTSLEKGLRLRSAPELYQVINEANKENLKAQKKQLPKYAYCDYVITSTRCDQFSKLGIDFRVPTAESAHIRELDAQKEVGKAIYGSAYLLSERLKVEKEKAEREKAEREKAEREKAERWELSEREMEIVRSLEVR